MGRLDLDDAIERLHKCQYLPEDALKELCERVRGPARRGGVRGGVGGGMGGGGGGGLSCAACRASRRVLGGRRAFALRRASCPRSVCAARGSALPRGRVRRRPRAVVGG